MRCTVWYWRKVFLKFFLVFFDFITAQGFFEIFTNIGSDKVFPAMRGTIKNNIICKQKYYSINNIILHDLIYSITNEICSFFSRKQNLTNTLCFIIIINFSYDSCIPIR